MQINAVTYSKAVAIILMVLAHARIFQYGQYWINMFHMPLFFMMSGYCFKDKYLADTKTFLSRRVSGIYWPFIKWSIIFLLLHNLFFNLNIYSDEYGYKGKVSELLSINVIFQRVFSTVFALGDSEQLLGGFWFLRDLFLGSIIFYITLLFTRKHQWLGGAFLLVITFCLVFIGTQTNFYSARTCLASVFIWLGYMLKNSGFKKYKAWWFPIMGFLIVSMGALFWQTSCLSVKPMTYFPFVFTALLGSLSVLCLCEKMEKYTENWFLRLFRFIGENTLTILTWHFLSLK